MYVLHFLKQNFGLTLSLRRKTIPVEGVLCLVGLASVAVELMPVQSIPCATLEIDDFFSLFH